MRIAICLLLLLYIFPASVFANNVNCEDRYLTIVNPVRGRNLWFDPSLTSIENQYGAIKDNDFKATWLLQYDDLKDPDLIKEIKSFNRNQELGVLLEVSYDLATDSRAIYPYDEPWYHPNAVFLSAYSQSERTRMIDELFNKFKSTFGYYPRSVGSWWIDSYSLEYLSQKYGVVSALIVSDQKTTDNYGVWGQWWGVPYMPSKENILIPADSYADSLDLVVIQWALRDPTLSIGEGPLYSNYSMQANDYIKQGRDTDYFKYLSDIYLDCKNQLGQITVGLETGIESLGYIDEYKRQLELLGGYEDLSSVTMSDFYSRYKTIYKLNPKEISVVATDSAWLMTLEGRTNNQIGETKKYAEGIAFGDYFVPDGESFLDRELPDISDQKDIFYFPLWSIVFGLGLVSVRLKRISLNSWVLSLLFAFATYGLILRSFYEYGWRVYMGPVFQNLIIVQVAIALLSFITILLICKFSNKFKEGQLLPVLCVLAYGLDPVVKSLRYTFLSGFHYFGIATDSLNFIGLKTGKFPDIKYVSQDLLPYQADALIRFDFNRIWDNLLLTLIGYPLIHILIGTILFFVIRKLNVKVVRFAIILLLILFLFHLVSVFTQDPQFVRKINL